MNNSSYFKPLKGTFNVVESSHLHSATVTSTPSDQKLEFRLHHVLRRRSLTPFCWFPLSVSFVFYKCGSLNLNQPHSDHTWNFISTWHSLTYNNNTV